MKRVTGIGGIFFKAKDAPSLQAWYKRHLGIDVQVWGGAAFDWTDAEGKPVAGTTAWCIDPQESDHFAPSSASFMVNYRVEDLHVLVKVLKEEGCNVLEKIDESEYGIFAWVIDPEGKQGRAVAAASRLLSMKQSGKSQDTSASELISKRIAELGDWRRGDSQPDAQAHQRGGPG